MKSVSEKFLFAGQLLFFLFIFSCTSVDDSTFGFHHYYVAKNGTDSGEGNQESPFLTINHAAELALPGDTVTVRAGIYREWVKPVRGGNSEDNRITYQASPGEDVRILGSEAARGWTEQEPGIWQINLPDAFFGDFNPFNTSIRHPQYVEADEGGEGWGWLRYGRWTHLGDVYLDREGLTEKRTIEEVKAEELSWHTIYESGQSTITANFAQADPNQSEVEINVRPYAFYPDSSGLGYITVRGFTFMNIATHWAPPTVPQPGAIGANGGHHWTIEDNIILYSKTVAISIGIPTGEADEDASGHHIIQNNVLMRCGQAGTTGQWWADHSQIIGNHIEAINYREEFGGWETAGIKHHAADSLIVRNNFIRDVRTADSQTGAAHGIWNDWRNSNWRVSNNIVLDAEAFPILVEANWGGPSLYENNIFVGGEIATFSSRGDAWVHNLFIENGHRWINQDHGGRPLIGNLHWFNNIFSAGSMLPGVEADSLFFQGNVYLAGALHHPEDRDAWIPESIAGVGVEETQEGVILKIEVSGDLAQRNTFVIQINEPSLPFSFDATIDLDFFGENRVNDRNLPGPFADLSEGATEILIYKYPKLYQRAVEIIRGD